MIIMQNGTNTKFKKINPKLLEIEKARTQELTSREFQIQRGSSGVQKIIHFFLLTKTPYHWKTDILEYILLVKMENGS